MFEFLEYMKSYLETKFANDNDLPNSFEMKVYDAYTTGHKPTKTEIQIQIMNDSEVDRYSSFDSTHISNIPLEIVVYAFQMKLDNKMVSAREVSIRIADKVKVFLNELRESNVNDNIKRVRIITTSPALPTIDGEKSYMTAIRCEFWVANPYVVPVVPTPSQPSQQEQSEQQIENGGE